MYIPIGTIVMVIIVVFLVNSWQSVSIQHNLAVKEKERLIKEAKEVIASMDHLSWPEMTIRQKQVHECAIQRLRLLQSYKKNHACDNYPFMKDWPAWFDPKSLNSLK